MSRNGSTQAGSAAGLDSARPLDQCVTALIEDARKAGRGFAMTVAQELSESEGKAVTFKVEKGPADEWEPPSAYRAHTIEDAESLVAYATRYGSKDKSLVVFNDTRVVLSLDEQVARGEREKATLSFAYSADWNTWAAMLAGKKVAHRDLLTFLILQQHNMDDPALLDSMRSIKATAQVKLDSDVRLEKEEVGVVFTATAGDDLVKFPRAFTVRVPVLDKDVDQQASWEELPVRVEVTLPTEPKQPVYFQLLAPTLGAVRRARITEEVQTIRDGLPGWIVVRGEHHESERTLGQEA